MTIALAGLPADVRADLTTDSHGRVTVTYPINKERRQARSGQVGAR